ncbi:stage V sporulation protein AC [Alicyclobacillus hesperidum subsp. aegles]|uniref:stage V sporulation protein AC n=1 Tax=Alicyclobacillus hesperidum TaxID=89784 RepID=UPI00222D8A03|nr:stage V sporulation protein AC [Alicyclobacillus hesperidum]GLG01763.1 stage V sporulation protein AC [Alicyclobacillus hesperidum subsp. aegles]
MANQKLKKATPTMQKYQQFAKAREPARPILRNLTVAFVVGGLICVLGQAIQDLFVHVFGFSQKDAGNPTVAVLIALTAMATGLGAFDKFARWAGAGTAVPVTGFANSMVSAAMEYRTEGFVLGVAGNMFKLAGSVIVWGVVSAFFIGLIRTLLVIGR